MSVKVVNSLLEPVPVIDVQGGEETQNEISALVVTGVPCIRTTPRMREQVDVVCPARFERPVASLPGAPYLAWLGKTSKQILVDLRPEAVSGVGYMLNLRAPGVQLRRVRVCAYVASSFYGGTVPTGTIRHRVTIYECLTGTNEMAYNGSTENQTQAWPSQCLSPVVAPVANASAEFATFGAPAVRSALFEVSYVTSASMGQLACVWEMATSDQVALPVNLTVAADLFITISV